MLYYKGKLLRKKGGVVNFRTLNPRPRCPAPIPLRAAHIRIFQIVSGRFGWALYEQEQRMAVSPQAMTHAQAVAQAERVMLGNVTDVVDETGKEAKKLPVSSCQQKAMEPATGN